MAGSVGRLAGGFRRGCRRWWHRSWAGKHDRFVGRLWLLRLLVGRLVGRLTRAPYNLPILVDLRGQFSSKVAVYDHLFNHVWPGLTHRVLIGLSPVFHRASMRE